MIRIETYSSEIDETIFQAIAGYTAGIRPDSEPEEDLDARAYRLTRVTWNDHDGTLCVEAEELEEVGGDYVEVGKTRFFAVDDHIITIY